MVSKKNKVIFLLPPKTGSTSLKKCLIDAGINFSNQIKRVDYPVYHSTLSEIMEVYDIKENELDEYKIVQIVRNPFDRFISAWQHQIDISSRMLSTSYSLSEMINKVEFHKNLLPNEIDKFYELFYGSVKFKINSFKNGTWGGMRFWCEQNWWNTKTDTTKYFKLEDLKTNTSELSDYIKINLSSLPHIKPNSQSKRNLDYRAYYTEENMNSVKKLFNNDITLFNYEF
jgi:hypothetical protein